MFGNELISALLSPLTDVGWCWSVVCKTAALRRGMKKCCRTFSSVTVCLRSLFISMHVWGLVVDECVFVNYEWKKDRAVCVSMCECVSERWCIRTYRVWNGAGRFSLHTYTAAQTHTLQRTFSLSFHLLLSHPSQLFILFCSLPSFSLLTIFSSASSHPVSFLSQLLLYLCFLPCLYLSG